jgi:hypothetical protein
MTDLDVALKIVVGLLTSVFLLLGIIIRARELRAGGGGKKDGGE